MPSLTLLAPVPSGRRLPQIDELKGLAILLVVLYHAGGTLVWKNQIHGDLGVDIFVILSGVGLALGRPATSTGDFLRRRLGRIMPTYWIALTLYWALNSHFLQKNYSVAEVGLHYLGIHAFFGDFYAMGINDSFWFITLILFLYACYAVLRRWTDQPDRLLLAGAIISVALALAYFHTNQGGVFGHFALRVPGFFLGVLVGQLLKTGRLELPLSRLMAVALLFISYVPYTQGIVFHTVFVGAILMLAYIFALRPALPAGVAQPVCRVLAFFGRYSLEIFLLHQPLIREYVHYCLGRFLGITAPTPLDLIPAMAVGFGLTLFLSVELHRLLARLPWNRQAPVNP